MLPTSILMLWLTLASSASKLDGVRLLARGAITSNVNISVNSASKAAVAAVEKAGGKVTVVA